MSLHLHTVPLGGASLLFSNVDNTGWHTLSSMKKNISSAQSWWSWSCLCLLTCECNMNQSSVASAAVCRVRDGFILTSFYFLKLILIKSFFFLIFSGWVSESSSAQFLEEVGSCVTQIAARRWSIHQREKQIFPPGVGAEKNRADEKKRKKGKKKFSHQVQLRRQ